MFDAILTHYGEFQITLIPFPLGALVINMTSKVKINESPSYSHHRVKFVTIMALNIYQTINQYN